MHYCIYRLTNSFLTNKCIKKKSFNDLSYRFHSIFFHFCSSHLILFTANGSFIRSAVLSPFSIYFFYSIFFSLCFFFRNINSLPLFWIVNRIRSYVNERCQMKIVPCEQNIQLDFVLHVELYGVPKFKLHAQCTKHTHTYI